eukprot:3219589-Pleurochrysis_carterae.AAC.3
MAWTQGTHGLAGVLQGNELDRPVALFAHAPARPSVSTRHMLVRACLLPTARVRHAALAGRRAEADALLLLRRRHGDPARRRRQTDHCPQAHQGGRASNLSGLACSFVSF